MLLKGNIFSVTLSLCLRYSLCQKHCQFFNICKLGLVDSRYIVAVIWKGIFLSTVCPFSFLSIITMSDWFSITLTVWKSQSILTWSPLEVFSLPQSIVRRSVFMPLASISFFSQCNIRALISWWSAGKSRHGCLPNKHCQTWTYYETETLLTDTVWKWPGRVCSLSSNDVFNLILNLTSMMVKKGWWRNNSKFWWKRGQPDGRGGKIGTKLLGQQLLCNASRESETALKTLFFHHFSWYHI